MSSGRRRAELALIVLAAVAWVLVMRAAYAGLYIEPTDAAVARAAAARPGGIAAAAALVVSAGALAAVSRRWWLAALGLPGLLAGGSLVVAPSSHGAAFVYGLGASVLALVAVAVVNLRGWRPGSP